MKLGIWLWGGMLFLASCSQESAQPDLPAGTSADVTAELSVSVSPMTALCTSVTRSQEGDSDSKALQVDYLSGGTTRADVDKLPMEKEIKSAYVVQFDGTSAGSTAVWVSMDVSAQIKSSSAISCSFTLTSGVKSRVYVIANPTKVPTVNMTLQSFETVAYTASSALPSTGLPMAASQDVALDDAFDVFQLRSPLARLAFTTNTGTLSLRGIPSAYSLAPATAGASAVRPSDVTYTATAALTSGTSYYVPANLSGQVDLSDPILRCSSFAPANSMYVVISANSTTYHVYLGDGSARDFNVVSNYACAISASVNGTDAVDMRVGTPPTITALDDGGGTANCYIATSANTWYSFNGKVMGNGQTTPVPSNLNAKSVASAITPTALNPASTDVLWETWNTTSTPVKGSVVRGVYLANGRMIFRTGTSEGNAVVAAYASGSSTPCWSWHIWRMNSDPRTSTFSFPAYTSTSGNFDDTGSTSHSGITIMTYNLGALGNAAQSDLSTGLHYQWGRKDPMPASAGLISPNDVVMATQPAGIPSIGSGGSIANAIANPTKFYIGDDDWTIRNDNLWGTALTGIVSISNGSSYNYSSNYGSKSIYDPCPAGWRIPPGYVYAILNTTNFAWDASGRSYSSHWFPATGYRSNSNGVLKFAGSRGIYWTAAPKSSSPTFGSFLFFDSYGINPTGEYYFRADGISCRCAME